MSLIHGSPWSARLSAFGYHDRPTAALSRRERAQYIVLLSVYSLQGLRLHADPTTGGLFILIRETRLGITRELINRLLSLVFPPLCLACREVEGFSALDLGLCSECRRRLRPMPLRVCRTCGRPGSSRPAEGYTCGACLGRAPRFDRLLAAWRYEPPLDRVIQALKFGRLFYLGDELARHLAERFHDQAVECDVVVPVPLHWSRQLVRGYNQAEEIARPLARRLGLPLLRGLRRRRRTPPQTRLNRRGRAANLRDAFRARRQARLCDRTILLVDDVVTTGATLSAAAASLQSAGAYRVVALTAGWTPFDSESHRQRRETGVRSLTYTP